MASDTKERILEAALEMFSQSGYVSAISRKEWLDEITKRSNEQE